MVSNVAEDILKWWYRMDTIRNVILDYKFDTGWIWLLVLDGYDAIFISFLYQHSYSSYSNIYIQHISTLALDGATRPSSKLVVNMFSLCTSKKKTIRGFSQKISRIFKIFKNLMTIEFWWRQIFEILMIHKPSLKSLDVPQKIWARSVQPFWRLLDTNKQTNKQTNRQTDRQTDKPNLYIDE